MALALVACFGELAEACAKPLMDACAQSVLPPLKTFIIDILRKHESNIGPISPVVEPVLAVDQMNNDVMILATDLTIHDPKNKHWDWEWFKEAAELAHGSKSLEIKASINFDLLSAGKTYSVYLIFKTTPESEGLDAVLTATVSTEWMDEPKEVMLSLKPKADADQKSRDIKLPVKSRYDEWMELELGQFLCSKIANKREADVSIKVKESGKHNKKGHGLIVVAGIEVRCMSY